MNKNFIKVAIDSPAAAGAGSQAKLISKHYKLLYLDTGKIYRVIGKKYIKNNYKNFDTVLFSCGGSSFSNFKNYMERGEYFKEMIVGEIS